MKHTFNLAAAVALLGLGAIQAQGQSVNFNFSDGTADGWANTGFGNSPVASVTNIGGQNYIAIPLGGFQVANIGTSDSSTPLYAAMAAAAANPAGYNISYDYYINTAAFSGATFLQIGSFVNTGNGDYFQDFGTPKEVELNGSQLASGQVFSGHVSINMAAAGLNMAAGQTFFRVGLIENGGGTGVVVDFSNISVAAVPEPSTLALAGLGAIGVLLRRRRHA
jgi:PEP-CTERM motif